MVSPSHLQETVCHSAHKRVQASLHSMRRPLTLVDKRPLLSSLPSHPPKHPSLFFLSITATQTKPHLYNHSHLEQSPSAYANGIYLSSVLGRGVGSETHTLEHLFFPAIQNPIISKRKSHFKDTNHLNDKEITTAMGVFQYSVFNSVLDF